MDFDQTERFHQVDSARMLSWNDCPFAFFNGGSQENLSVQYFAISLFLFQINPARQTVQLARSQLLELVVLNISLPSALHLQNRNQMKQPLSLSKTQLKT